MSLPSANRLRWLRVCILACGATVGCASPHYRFGASDAPADGGPPRREVSRGGQSPRLDRVERFFDTPSRWKWIPDAPPDAPSDETLAAVDRYLSENGIEDLTIAINEYDPRQQWSRLRENRQLSAGWRYPLGSVSCAFAAVFPARVFDRTGYNAYTNTLVVNGDDLPEILAAAAYAKDLRTRSLRGPYALMANLPILSIVHRVSAASDVLSYARHHEDWSLEEEAYRCLYPRLGAQGAVAIVSVPSIFLQPVVAMGGGLVGRSVAELQIRRLRESRQLPEIDLPDDPLWAGHDDDVPSLDNRVTPVDAVFRDDDDLRKVTFPEP